MGSCAGSCNSLASLLEHLRWQEIEGGWVMEEVNGQHGAILQRNVVAMVKYHTALA